MGSLIKKWIKEGYITPAGGRLLEVSIVCGIAYILGAIIDGQVFSLQGVVIATLSPIYQFISKAKRDLEKDLESNNKVDVN